MNLALLGIILIIIAFIFYIYGYKRSTTIKMNKLSRIILVIGIIINIIGVLLIIYVVSMGPNNGAVASQYRYYVNGVQVPTGFITSTEGIIVYLMIFVLGFSFPFTLAKEIVRRKRR